MKVAVLFFLLACGYTIGGGAGVGISFVVWVIFLFIAKAAKIGKGEEEEESSTGSTGSSSCRSASQPTQSKMPKNYLTRCESNARYMMDYLKRVESDDEVMELLRAHKALDPLVEGSIGMNVDQRLGMVFSMDIIKAFREAGYDLSSCNASALPLSIFTHHIIGSVNYYDFSGFGALNSYYNNIMPQAIKFLQGIDYFNVYDDSKIAKFNMLELLKEFPEKNYYVQFHDIVTRLLRLTADNGVVYKSKAEGYIAKHQETPRQLYGAKSNDENGGHATSAKSGGGGRGRGKQSLADSMEELNGLIGLGAVKEEVTKLTNFIEIQRKRQEAGLKCSPISYHCVFTGNPGTGKTTVARIIASIYTSLGILKKGHLVETDRSGLVAEYVGQTAVKTNKIIDSALDGVLFIDEAYTLAQGGSNDYGYEAIATLLKRMEDDRSRLVVVLAGYNSEMRDFIDTNPGLESRFNRYINFEDYTVDELVEIYLMQLSRHEYVITPDAIERIKATLTEDVATKDENFGNARHVRNLFEKTLENQASRLAALTAESLSRDTLQQITAADIPA